jgi:hypothetical protein
MKRAFIGITAFVGMAILVASQAVSQPPGGAGKDEKGGAQKGPQRFELGQVLPPPLIAELKLTPEQEKELETIKTDLKAKLDKLLTAEQKKTIENFRPRGAGGPGGPGGPGGGNEKGAKGGMPPMEKGGGAKGGAEKGGDRPDRPAIEK